MKVAKFFGVFAGILFGLAGLALMVGSVGLAFKSLNQPVQLTEVPVEAKACSENLMEAVGRGDYAAAGDFLYGQPDLGVDREPEDEMGKKVWEAFLGSISYEFTSDCYATDSGISRDASITTLNIASAGTKLKERVQANLDAQVAAAEELETLYGEGGSFREELVLAALEEAVDSALKEDTTTVTRDVTMNLIYREGQWWVVPDQALLQAISGNMAN